MTVLRGIKARKLYFAVQGRFAKSKNPECAMRWMQEAMKSETSFLQLLTEGGDIHSHQDRVLLALVLRLSLARSGHVGGKRGRRIPSFFCCGCNGREPQKRLPVRGLSRESVAGHGDLRFADFTNEGRIWLSRQIYPLI